MGLKMMPLFLLLASVCCLAVGSTAPATLEGITRDSYIRRFGAALYDTEFLREEHARRRRDAAAPGGGWKSVAGEQPLVLHLHALDRVFKMRLERDVGLFATDVRFEGSKGRPVAFNTPHAYRGILEDDESASVHGVVTSEGLFDGTVNSGNGDEIYIEPASRYLKRRKGGESELPYLVDVSSEDVGPVYHTIAYRSTDVVTPRQERSCNSEILRKNSTLKFNHRNMKNEADYQPNTSQPIYQHLNDGKSHAKPGFYPKDARRKNPTASSHNLELLDKLYRERYSRVLRKRTSVDPKKTTCMLYLQADHTFFAHYKSEEACIEVMTRHVQRVNAIYRYTDFNQDGQPDNISFMIKRVKVHGHEALQDPDYRFTGSYGVEEFLELFSEEDYDAFCLSYMFTYRDFEKGTLGLAWTGDLKNAGGVCEKNGHYRGSMKSLNTGIITLLNYGKHVPPAVSHVTLAHEIGHNFGSPHDPDECSPGGEDGNFIMFARATSGDKRNNNRFSPCSLLSINPVLNAKARSSKGCFAEPQSSICGNGVVEEGEECDCGWEEDCNDPCCHPQRRHHPIHEIPCRLTEGSVCSPSQGPCCTSGCTLRNGEKCRDDNGCRDASFCDGSDPQCPQSINKPNKTICNEEFVCYMGECTGSICLAYGLESCQCIAGPDDHPTKSCELCCKIPGENQPCLSSFAWNSPPYDIPDMFSKPGTPCNDYNGYCDVFQNCREVDPSGPLATLRRLLLSDASLATFQRWITEHWYAVAALVLAAVTALVAVAQLFGRRGVTKKLSSPSGEFSKGVTETSKDSLKESVVKKGRSSVARMINRIVETMKRITSPRRSSGSVKFFGTITLPKIFNFTQSMRKGSVEKGLSKILRHDFGHGEDKEIEKENEDIKGRRSSDPGTEVDFKKHENYSTIIMFGDENGKDESSQDLRGTDRGNNRAMRESSSDYSNRGVVGNWLLRDDGAGEEDPGGFGRWRNFYRDNKFPPSIVTEENSSYRQAGSSKSIGEKSSSTSCNYLLFNNIFFKSRYARDCQPKISTSSSKRYADDNRLQSAEPLVEPETPETPESPATETNQSQITTSDLAVLLGES